jgi:transcription elongation factor Elf1
MASNLAWKCPHCKRWQVAIPRAKLLSKITLKCLNCGKQTKLKKDKEIGLATAVKVLDSPQEATHFVQGKNEQESS